MHRNPYTTDTGADEVTVPAHLSVAGLQMDAAAQEPEGRTAVSAAFILDREGLALFERLHRDHPDPVLLTVAGRFILANAAALSAFGVVSQDDLLQCGPLDVSPELQLDGTPSASKFRAAQGRALQRGRHRVDWLHKRLDNGEPVDHEMTLIPVCIDGCQGFHVALREQGRQRRTETALRRADLLLRTVYATTDEAVVVIEKSQIVVANEAAVRIFGCSSQQRLSELPLSALSPDLQPDGTSSCEWLVHHLEARGGRSGAFEWHFRRQDNGLTFPADLRLTSMSIDGRDFAQLMIRNVSRWKDAESEIRQLAYFDGLTQLANRRQLIERLGRALASSSRTGLHAALLIIDLDKFKAVNERLGREQGDLLLQIVARRLNACTRANDTVARLGDDEFVVVFRDLSAEPLQAAVEAEAGAAKVLAEVRSPFALEGAPWEITASIGVTLFAGDGTAEALLRRADLAMSAAKGAGGNRMRFFDPTIQHAVNERGALDADLRVAIERGQFALHYQPQIDAAKGVVGAEALLRWRHPDRGMVPPAQFIPLAEETGQILPLGRWVLQAACSQLAAWRHVPQADHLTIAVNVSALQIRQPEFVEEVIGAVRRTGANPALLKLELTESLMLDGMEDIIAKMAVLKAIGVCFSLDDFGTGYSSLAYLKRLPLDQLKIDQTFVHDLLADPNDAAIVRTIVALARSLGLDVIAEGVETVEQQAWLSNNGCHTFQGFLFSRPLPADDFVKLLPMLGPVRLFIDTGLAEIG